MTRGKRITVTRTDEKITAALAEAIRDLRHAHGMTQGELAAQLGVTFQQVQKYETGVNRVTVGRFVSIARAFGLSPAALLACVVRGAS